MKILVGGREGVLILDPGYHVARAVTVMKDQKYPHTGWFTQSDEPHCKREYSYGFHELNDNYITWTERMTRGAKQQYEQSLVYIGRPYRTAIDVTVRRNLVYNFRSLLSRDAKGRVCAGLYFPVVPNPLDAQVTLFYDGPLENQVKQKFKFSLFKDAEMVSSAGRGALEKCRNLTVSTVWSDFRSPIRCCAIWTTWPLSCAWSLVSWSI